MRPPNPLGLAPHILYSTQFSVMFDVSGPMVSMHGIVWGWTLRGGASPGPGVLFVFCFVLRLLIDMVEVHQCSVPL